MEYNSEKHILLRDVAHKEALYTEEYFDFEASVRAAGIPIEVVDVPDWPSVPYGNCSGWIIFGKTWWADKQWTGSHSVIDPSYHRQARKIAKEQRGDKIHPKRVAYVWDCEIFDPAKHVVMRYWLAENELDIVEFLNKFIPRKERELGRSLLFSATNPRVLEERSTGSYSPVRRVILLSDMDILEEFAGGSEKFTYNAVQSVSWERAVDDSRWEARRTRAPQSDTWVSHRSWIMRALGSGKVKDDDVDADGWKFGPFMELFDDGMLWVWSVKRALKSLENNSLSINGVNIRLEPETFGPVSRMVGHISEMDMLQILNGNTPVPVSGESESVVEPVVVENVKFNKSSRNNNFFHCVSDLPGLFYREEGSLLVLQVPNEVRFWGHSDLFDRGLTVNGYRVSDVKPFKGGYKGVIDGSVEDIVLVDKGSEVGEVEVAPTPENSGSVLDGSKIYSPSSVISSIEDTLGKPVRLFGRSSSDSAICALTRDGLDRFLKEDVTDRLQYVNDNGGRNFDCENFSETLRVNLVRKYGVNSCAVIWGDGHAWCAFAVVGSNGPEIVMIEPQSDDHVRVENLKGMYSVERRAEVLL